MEARRRFDQAAAAILAVVGVLVVGWVAVNVVQHSLPAIASDNPRQRDGALFGLILIGIPVALGGLLTLLIARLLWHGHPWARTLALVWSVVAGLASGIFSFGTVLWAVGMMVLHPEAVSVRWPRLYYDNRPPSPDGSPVFPTEELSSVHLDSLDFWVPGIVAIGVLAIASLLLAGWIARARRVRLG
jgi:hypothetical protein